jgi:hypothetical protein
MKYSNIFILASVALAFAFSLLHAEKADEKFQEKRKALHAKRLSKNPPLEFNSAVSEIGGCGAKMFSGEGCAIVVINNETRVKAYMRGPVLQEKVSCKNGVALIKTDNYIKWMSEENTSFWEGWHTMIVCETLK